MSVNGRVVIVTGATAGIGEEIAVFLGVAGARVVVAGRNAERGAAVVAKIMAKGGGAVFVPHDLQDRDSGRVVLQATIDAFGGADIVVANAGGFFGGTFDELTPAGFDKAIAVNIRGSFELVQQAIPGMMDRNFGRVIFISSPASEFPAAGAALYAMTKSGLNGLMRSLVPEYGPYGITFNAIQPGATRTPMSSFLFDGDPTLAARLEAAHPDGRLGVPADTAHATLMFADELAGHVSGMSLLVDGGHSHAAANTWVTDAM